MAEYARLVVSVDSSQVRKANTDLSALPGTASKVERAALRLGPAIAAAITVQTIRSTQQLAEKFTLLEARVTRLSASTADAEATYLRLADVARRTGTDLGDTVQLWESLTGTLRELGATDSQVIRLTETLQKIGAVGGSSAQDMSNALRQLGQALAGGQLRAEEFNSIVEGMPELAREIARGLGVPFGELRQQMLDGELTAERVLGALQSRAASVDAEFEKVPRTVSQASAALTNDLGRAISKLDQTIGTSKGFVWLLDTLSKGARLTFGDLTEFERFNELVAQRTKLQERYEQAQRRTILSDKERAVFENGIARLGDEISKLQDRRIQQIKEEGKAIEGTGTAQNEQYDKYLAKLSEGAALQGVTSEAAKVRYAIETGALGKLLPEQERALLNYAEEIDAKRSATQRTTEMVQATEQLQQSYRSASNGLERQLALYGQTTAAAQLNYDLASGSLKGIVGQQADYLLGLARELDAKRDLTEQEKLRIDILRESGQLRAANDAQFDLEYAEKIAEYERQGNVEALKRLETLRRIREIQMNADQAPGTVEGVSAAPVVGAVDASIAGPFGEMAKLNEQAAAIEQWRATEIEKQRAFLDAKAINEEQHAQRVANINEQNQQRIAQYEDARYAVGMAAGAEFFGTMTSMVGKFAGEQSSSYKALFAMQKAFAVASIIMNAQIAAAKAPAEMTIFAGIPMGAAILAMGYANAAMVGGMALAGMAHDGIDSIPREGTWLLDKGERVVDRRTNADLKEYLSEGGKGGGKGDVSIPINVNVTAQQGVSEADAQRQGAAIAKQIEGQMMQVIVREKRPGGLLS